MQTMIMSPFGQPEFVQKKDLEKLEKKVDVLSNKIEGLKHDMLEEGKNDMAIWRDQIRSDFKVANEVIIGNFDNKLKDVEERLSKKIDTKLSQNYFTDYMEDFKSTLK